MYFLTFTFSAHVLMKWLWATTSNNVFLCWLTMHCFHFVYFLINHQNLISLLLKIIFVTLRRIVFAPVMSIAQLHDRRINWWWKRSSTWQRDISQGMRAYRSQLSRTLWSVISSITEIIFFWFPVVQIVYFLLFVRLIDMVISLKVIFDFNFP